MINTLCPLEFYEEICPGNNLASDFVKRLACSVLAGSAQDLTDCGAGWELGCFTALFGIFKATA